MQHRAYRIEDSDRIASRGSRVAGPLVTVALALMTFCAAAAPTAPPIPESSIGLLQVELDGLKTSRASSSTKRRTCKGVIRDAQALVRAQPDAPNRFPVLALQLEAQQRLLQMENTERNRDAFFKTCEALAQAPDAYSSDRLNAELMLSERELSSRDADAAERITALSEMQRRYRDTPGELEFLMAAVRVATQLGDYAFKAQLVTDMSERFAGNPTAINYRRTLIGATRMDIVFSGSFERLDGTSMTFPFDRLGHAYLAVFWSKESPVALEKLKQLKEQQQQAPDIFEIYSFNLDELPDGGRSVINEIGLTCTVLRLPGGVQSETFRTYALRSPAALRVNHFGHAIVPPNMAVHSKNVEEARAFVGDDHLRRTAGVAGFDYPRSTSGNHGPAYAVYDRHLSQIQSLLIGDHLVADAEPKGTDQPDTNAVGAETLEAIHACFLPVPLRYRLTKAEALANYKKANALCIKAIATSPKASDLWQVRNYRIVALMGMASISGSTQDFEEAIEEARTTAALTLPEGAGVVAHFCLAKEALRLGSDSAREIVDGFIAACGAEGAGLKAYSAAAILAIHADSRELYQHCRSTLLESPDQPEALAAFIAFLRNRYHQYYLFRGNPIFYLYSREYRFAERRFLIDDGLTPMTLPLPAFELKGLDGKMISLPDTGSDRLTLLLFVEPSSRGSNELARLTYAPPGEPTERSKNPRPSGLLASAATIAGHNNNGLRCITVFLCDDVERVEAIRDKYALPGLLTVLPGGLNHPIVNQLGILSADRNVNSFLVRRDGTIAWSKNGLTYQMAGALTYISTLGWNVQIDICDSEAGYRALKNKEYRKALQLFSGSYLLEPGQPSQSDWTGDLLRGRRESDGKWKSSRFHGRALANLGLGDYDSALADVDSAISQHLRRGQFNHDPENPCRTMLYLQTTRSKALDGLGRQSEARTARNRAAVKPTHYPSHYTRIRGFNEPCEAFEDRLSIVAKEIK